jgi:hypothetical protein
MAGFGLYSGVGVPSAQNQNQQGITSSPIQSFSTMADYSANSAGGIAAPANGGTQNMAGQQPIGMSTMNSGFNGLGGVSKADYYLPGSANSDLRSTTMDPFQMSAQLGGGQIRSEDIAALRQAQTNSQDSGYSAFASHAIDPTNYLNQYKAGNYNGAADYFQQQSQHAPVQGVKYGLDPSFGLTGSIGDLNFDALRYNQNWNAPAAFQAFNPYLEMDGVDRGQQTMQQVQQFTDNLRNGRQSDANGFYIDPARQFQFQGGPQYAPDGSLSSYQGSYSSPSVSNQYNIPNTGLWWEG